MSTTIKLKGRVDAKRLEGKINLVPSASSGGPLQAKTVYPSHDEQSIAPDEDYYGLAVVKVLAVPKVRETVVTVKDTADVEMLYTLNTYADVSADVYAFSDEPLDYDVIAVEGATYGFALNSNGFYESQNKGVNGSYAMCKVVFRSLVNRLVTLRCINYAEGSYDHGIISLVDTMLEMTNTDDTKGVWKSLTEDSPSVVEVTFPLPAGEHFVCIKFRKDGSTSNNNDSLQFAVAN